MKQTKTFCDRCKEEMISNVGKVIPVDNVLKNQYMVKVGQMMETQVRDTKLDLCITCQKALLKFLEIKE